MEVGDRESSFSIGMALPVWMEPEGNPGILMAQEGEILASMTWKEGRKGLVFAWSGLVLYSNQGFHSVMGNWLLSALTRSYLL